NNGDKAGGLKGGSVEITSGKHLLLPGDTIIPNNLTMPLQFLRLCLRFPTALAAENLFLRKQLALYQERRVAPRRATTATRLALTWLSAWFDWRQALVIVQPATLLRWHREGFRLFWRWKSRRGRPSIPVDLQALIRQMARENPTWGQERIANEL